MNSLKWKVNSLNCKELQGVNIISRALQAALPTIASTVNGSLNPVGKILKVYIFSSDGSKAEIKLYHQNR